MLIDFIINSYYVNIFRIILSQRAHPKEIQHEPYNLHKLRNCRPNNAKPLSKNLPVFKFCTHDN